MIRLLLPLLITFVLFPFFNNRVYAATTWNIQSIDTMKISRDLAREKLDDPSFDIVIDQQTKMIADTGVTHIAIATPYDEEFLPYLERWVKSARKYDLNVWFRGNFSGWEEWFEYEPITRKSHTAKIKKFIEDNPHLFKDGDLFSTCPECENGGPGDPRETKDVTAYRSFLISEYRTAQNAFKKINRDVQANMFSMNGDVARLIMDRRTTQALGGVVVVDHYVRSPDQLNRDVTDFAKRSGGKIILGEYGAPIPDIHGSMTEDQQLAWIEDAVKKLSYNPHLIGLNYWTHIGGSTELWSEDLKPRKVVSLLSRFYQQQVIPVKTVDELGNAVGGIKVNFNNRTFMTDDTGSVILPYVPPNHSIKAEGKTYEVTIHRTNGSLDPITFQMVKKDEGWWFRFNKWLKSLFGSF